jgi:hypothetical protein
MKSLWRLLLVTAVVMFGAAFVVACDDDGGDGGDEPTATTEEEATDEGDDDEATDTPEDEGDATEEDGDGDGGGSGATSIDDLPEPDDAEETASGSWSGTVPFFDPSGSVDADAYGQLDYKEYDTGMSSEEVIDFYKDAFSDWDEVYVLTGGAAGEAGGFGIWTTNDSDTVAWIGTSEGSDTTTVTVIVGSKT